MSTEIDIHMLDYDPPIEEHPDYCDTPDYEVGDVVFILRYRRNTVERDARGDRIRTTSRIANGIMTGYEVEDVDGDMVKLNWHGVDSGTWLPEEMIVGVDDVKTRQRRIERHVVERRQQADMDALLALCQRHAEMVCEDVWPGGTVDPADISWFWNTRLRSSAGKAYHGRAVPQMAGDARLAVGLAPAYYYQHGLADLLAVVRHELIHIWQYEHPDSRGGGHGPDFKQWIDDLDTHRHCNHWSK